MRAPPFLPMPSSPIGTIFSLSDLSAKANLSSVNGLDEPPELHEMHSPDLSRASNAWPSV